jgi:hypothetical protein
VDGRRRVRAGFGTDIEVGRVLIKEIDELAHEPALSLALFAEEEEIVAREDRVDELGDDGVVVAEDAGEEFAAFLQGVREVVTELCLDGT